MAVILLGIALAAVGTRAGMTMLDRGGDTANQAGASVSAAPTASGTDARYPDQTSRDASGRGAPDIGADTGSAVPGTTPLPAPPPPSGPASPNPPTAAPSGPASPSTSPARSSSAPATTTKPPTRTPSSSAAPSTSAATGAAAYEDQVLALVNNERAAAGCGPVKADVPLRDLARAFSKDMADRGYFSHNTPEGKTPWDRAEEAGISYLAAENIARGQQTPAAVMDAWMNSEGHRRNILNCGLTKLGVGVHLGSGGPWWTQEFGR